MARKTKNNAEQDSQSPIQEQVQDAASMLANGKIHSREISVEMRESYLDYAMSVIVQRALPDVRDGLKPVHRRILYAMHMLGLHASAKFRKSATVVGEVLGKYHPHGDSAVYDAMVRLAQDFAMRYPLVHGQGNFGSVDGDNPAAMRYTEAKMARITDLVLADIEKNTVDFVPNYDNTQQEPRVLPSRLPQLLLNGGTGIAVGMATNIPPHNLGEVCDALLHLASNPEATSEDLLAFIKGPDFPTGGIMYDWKEISQAYTSGNGRVVIRAKTEIVEHKDQFSILITELPYAVNKASLIEKIAELVKDKKLEAIKDVRDESDKDGIRIVVDLKRDAYPKKVLNQLFKLTQLQTTFHVNMLALVDGIQPRVLNVRHILEAFIEHRKTVVRRRTEFDLEKAKDRAHILEGLKKALDHIDAIIKTIKQSADKEVAHANLVKQYKLTDRQATAILEMKLQTLAGLERKKIEEELAEKRALIAELEGILKSTVKLLKIITTEITEMKEKFGDERRTKLIKGAVGELNEEDLIPDEEVIVSVSMTGYVKRIKPDAFRAQNRGGKGVIGANLKEEDIVEHLFSTRNLADVLFFTNTGKVYQTKAYELPEASRTSKGQAIVNFLSLAPGEKVTAILPRDSKDGSKYIVMLTKMGTIKKTMVSDFENVRRNGLIAIKIKPGDELNWARVSTGIDHLFVVTSQGQSIHFSEKTVREMGRTAAGVRAIKLKRGDEVVGFDVIPDALAKEKSTSALVLSEKGYGKRSLLENYKVQGRGGSGIKTAHITPKIGKLIGMGIIPGGQEKEGDLIIMSRKGQVIRFPRKSVPLIGRDTQGVRLMNVNPGDTLASFTMI